MNASPEEPQDDLVFDEAFIAAATIKEPSASERRGSALSRRDERRRRSLTDRPPAARSRSRLNPAARLGPRTLTVLLVALLFALAIVLSILDPIGLQK